MTAVRRLKLASLLSAAASVFFLPGAPLAQQSFELAQVAAACNDAKSHFDIAHEIDTPEAYQAHIDAFPDCPYASFAKMLRDKLTGASAAGPSPSAQAPATPTAPPATNQASVPAAGGPFALPATSPATGVPADASAGNPLATPAGPSATGTTSPVENPFAAPPTSQATTTPSPAVGNPFAAPAVPAQPAAPGVDEAKLIADTLVARLNSLPPMETTDAPQVHYDSATKQGRDVVLTNFRITKLDGQPGVTGAVFADARLVAPVVLPDGTLQADAVQLQTGTIGAIGPAAANDKIAEIKSATLAKLYLAAPGGSVGGERLGPISIDGLTASGITGHTPSGQTFTLSAVSLAVTGTTAHIPNALVVSLSDLSVPSAAVASGFAGNPDQVKKLGYDPFVFSADLVVKQDLATKTLEVQHGIGLKDGAQLRLSATIGAFDPTLLEAALQSGNPAALMTLAATLKNARLDYVDQSLTGKVLAFAAQTENVDPKLFVAAIPSVVKEGVAQATGSAALAGTVSDAIASFVAQPQSVSVSLDPQQPVGLVQLVFSLIGGADPMQLLSAFGPSLSVNGATSVPLQLADLSQPGAAPAAQTDVAALVTACDTLAADSDDPTKPADVAGVKAPGDIDHAQAIPACEAAHAAAPSEPRIAFELGRAYASAGRNDDAARLYREAADAGEAVAQYELAMDYYDGRGVPADPQEAIKLLEASSAQGNGFAKYWLGTEKVNGTNIPADYPDALKLFQEAADFGAPEALTELGKMYYRGQSVPVDYVKALDYFRSAALKNAASGYFYVGFMTALGSGGAQPNPASATADMMKGLLLGDPDAQAIIVDDGAKMFDVSIRKAIQTYLRSEGFYKGTADGVLGAGTQEAITAWRAAKGHA